MIAFDPTLVHEWLRRSAKRFPDKKALIFGDQHWTYAELDRASDQLARGLVRLGVRRHDRVVVLLETSPQIVVAMFGILKAGAAFVILNGAVKSPKLSYVLENSAARALITETGKASVVLSAFTTSGIDTELIWVASTEAPHSGPGHAWTALLEARAEETPLPRVIDVDLAALIYTSGSTGEPKGVVSTHHNMISAARSIIQYIENREDDVILSILPLSFDYGLYQVIMSVIFGGTVVLEKSFAFPHLLLNRIAEEKVTGFPIVPTVAAMLLRMQDLSQYDLSSLRYMTNTGAAFPPEHIHRLQALLPGVRIFSMFGLTECKRTCYLAPEDIHERADSVGMAMPNCEATVLLEDGSEAPPGVSGELVIRGSNVMQGYWKDLEVTARAYRPGAWRADVQLFSGDTFRRDEDGFLYFLGRHDDMIKSRGERISAKEVEYALSAMPGVAEAAVLGVPDEILGQALKAFVVPAADVSISGAAIKKYCTENIEPYMVPKFIELVSELPRSAHGKVDKKQLKHG